MAVQTIRFTQKSVTYCGAYDHQIKTVFFTTNTGVEGFFVCGDFPSVGTITAVARSQNFDRNDGPNRTHLKNVVKGMEFNPPERVSTLRFRADLFGDYSDFVGALKAAGIKCPTHWEVDEEHVTHIQIDTARPFEVCSALEKAGLI